MGEQTSLHAQGYFVYDSKKSGSETVSHLRFGPDPIRSAYLIEQADFVGIHHFPALMKRDLLAVAAPGATLLLNSPHGPSNTWAKLPVEVQETILAKQLEVWVVDAHHVAADAGMVGRINIVLQTCFFHLSGLLPPAEAIDAIKLSIRKTYARMGPTVLDRNYQAVDGAIAALHRMSTPEAVTSERGRDELVPAVAPDFVKRVTETMLAGDGDRLPVSALPVDGSLPTGTTKWEKRSIAAEIPIWDAEICIDCARCALVCPHAAIRLKVVALDELRDAPASFRHKSWKSGDETDRGIVQVAPDDCTGCGVCVSICPAGPPPRCRAGQLGLLPRASRGRPLITQARLGQGLTTCRASVRVLGSPAVAVARRGISSC